MQNIKCKMKNEKVEVPNFSFYILHFIFFILTRYQTFTLLSFGNHILSPSFIPNAS